MATVFRVLLDWGDCQLGYDYDDVAMELLTLPYMVGTPRPLTIRYDLQRGAGEVQVVLQTLNRTVIPQAQRPTVTQVPDNMRISGPFVAVSA